MGIGFCADRFNFRLVSSASESEQERWPRDKNRTERHTHCALLFVISQRTSGGSLPTNPKHTLCEKIIQQQQQ
jgi:hypothetical protein